MSAYSDYLKNKIHDHVLRNRSFTPASPLYWSLWTAAGTDAGGGTEVSGGNYSRVSITPSDTAFTNTQGTTSGASSGTGGTVSNGAIVQFPTPSASWGTPVEARLYDAASGGNMYIREPLVPKVINSGDDVKFPVGSSTLQIK